MWKIQRENILKRPLWRNGKRHQGFGQTDLTKMLTRLFLPTIQMQKTQLQSSQGPDIILIQFKSESIS